MSCVGCGFGAGSSPGGCVLGVRCEWEVGVVNVCIVVEFVDLAADFGGYCFPTSISGLPLWAYEAAPCVCRHRFCCSAVSNSLSVAFFLQTF